MYNSPAGIGAVSAGVATGGVLAFTGINVAYDICAAFALIAAGLAVARIAPKFSRTSNPK